MDKTHGEDRTTEKRTISVEDLKFLQALQDELLTQDTVCQADPRFWVVLTHKHEPCWEEHAEWFDIVRESDGECIGTANHVDETPGVYFVPMRSVEEIAKDTMFLTRRECREHIARNAYLYNNPTPFAMTAWRSPQFERLVKLLQQIDWEETIGCRDTLIRELYSHLIEFGCMPNTHKADFEHRLLEIGITVKAGDSDV